MVIRTNVCYALNTGIIYKNIRQVLWDTLYGIIMANFSKIMIPGVCFRSYAYWNLKSKIQYDWWIQKNIQEPTNLILILKIVNQNYKRFFQKFHLKAFILLFSFTFITLNMIQINTNTMSLWFTFYFTLIETPNKLN